MANEQGDDKVVGVGAAPEAAPATPAESVASVDTSNASAAPTVTVAGAKSVEVGGEATTTEAANTNGADVVKAEGEAKAVEAPAGGPSAEGEAKTANGAEKKPAKKTDPMKLAVIGLSGLLVVAIIFIIMTVTSTPKTTPTKCPETSYVPADTSGDEDEEEHDPSYNVADIPFQIRDMNVPGSTYIFPKATNEFADVKPIVEYSETGAPISGTNNHKEFTVTLSQGERFYGLPPEKDSLTGTVNFKQDVRLIQICGMGQAVGDEFIAFVMADGTVNYLPIYASLKSGEMKVEEIGGVSSVVSIVEGGVGGITYLFQRLDGGYYSASYLLQTKLDAYWQDAQE